MVVVRRTIKLGGFTDATEIIVLTVVLNFPTLLLVFSGVGSWKEAGGRQVVYFVYLVLTDELVKKYATTVPTIFKHLRLIVLDVQQQFGVRRSCQSSVGSWPVVELTLTRSHSTPKYTPKIHPKSVLFLACRLMRTASAKVVPGSSNDWKGPDSKV